MPNILCIETSGPICSVALFSNESTCIGYTQDDSDFQHAAVLTKLIDQLLKDLKLKPSDLNAVALSAGPGSYTGLRIGTSVAKGLCYALDIPLIAIGSLELLAFGLISEHCMGTTDVVCPAIDARRMEVYSALYLGDLTCIEDPEPKIITVDSYQNQLDKGLIHFVGSGSKKIAETIKHENLRYFSDDVLSAKYIGALAFAKWEKQQLEDIAYFEPYYLKAFHTTAKVK